MDNQMDREKLQKMLDNAAPNLRPEDKKQVEAALQSGSLDNILKNLKPSDSKKLQEVLSNKAAAQRLLSTPQAQMLLKKLMNDQK
ncbi:MAG: hypothetical protein HFE86_05830 [Clostridiales bacterium]|nr:hypothetical protein [Clostridiales bacterium]